MVNCFLPIHARIPLIISVKYFRVLKLIALFLHKYALNPDGDVKGMFETAYSSLFEDDPDLKKKRKEESLKKHRVCFHQKFYSYLSSFLVYLSSICLIILYILTLQNLLESFPSNEEFKSLLGNPKNIKDCGISVAQSLTILTDIWDKLSVSPTLL